MLDMRQGFRVRAPGRHRAVSHRRRPPLWTGAALLAVIALAVPLWLWPGRAFDARLGLGVDAPPAGIGAAQAPLGAPPSLPRGHGGYTFMRLQANGTEPVAYDPCRPIHFTLSSAGLPPGADVLVREAVATMSHASGLRFVDDGLTDEEPTPERDPYQPNRYGDRWAPVYIAFATPEQIPRLEGRTVGLGGSTPRAAGDGVLVYVTGSVWLDRDAMVDLLRAGRQDSVRAVIEHEIGHVLGLDHVSDGSQLMSESGGTFDGPGDGDLRGLALLGRGVCRPDL